LGNESPGQKACNKFSLIFFFFPKKADLIFKINEVPHLNFRRKGDDLIYLAKISLVNALCSDPI